MANTINYLSLTGLQIYDQKIKAFIDSKVESGVANSFKYVNLEDGVLKFYVNNPITEGEEAAFEIELPVQDLSHLMALVKDAVNGNIAVFGDNGQVVDGGVAVADIALKSEVDALEAKVGEVPEDKTVMGIIDEIIAGAYNDTEVRNLIAELDEKKADKTQVTTDIADAVKAEEDARKEAVKGVQDAVDALAGTHATDKKALEDAIALKADITALNAVSDVANAAVKQADYDVKVKALEDEDARIAGLVAAEAERASGVEADLDERLEEVEAFFKLAEGEKLDEALDTLKELQDFVNGEGAAADQMVLDIAANKKAIEDHIATDHDFGAADAALKEELIGEINKKATIETVNGIDGRLVTVEGKVTTLEGEMDDAEGRLDVVEGAVATKAEQADLEAEIAAREAGDAQALTDAKAYTDAEVAKDRARLETLEADTHTHANKSELDKIVDGDKAKWDAMEGNAKAYTDEKIDAEVTARNEAIATAKSEAITEAGTAADAKVKALEDGQVATNKADIAALTQTHNTDKAALEAKDAEIAKAVEDLEESLKEITVDEINALFPEA